MKNSSESILKHWDGGRIYELISRLPACTVSNIRDMYNQCQRGRRGEGEREMRNKEGEGAQLQHAASC